MQTKIPESERIKPPENLIWYIEDLRNLKKSCNTPSFPFYVNKFDWTWNLRNKRKLLSHKLIITRSTKIVLTADN